MERFSQRVGITKKDCSKFLDGLDEVVREGILAGDSFRLGFVGLEPRDVPAKAARNPKTGLPINVPAHKGVRVVVSSSLKAALKGK